MGMVHDPCPYLPTSGPWRSVWEAAKASREGEPGQGPRPKVDEALMPCAWWPSRGHQLSEGRVRGLAQGHTAIKW